METPAVGFGGREPLVGLLGGLRSGGVDAGRGAVRHGREAGASAGATAAVGVAGTAQAMKDVPDYSLSA